MFPSLPQDTILVIFSLALVVKDCQRILPMVSREMKRIMCLKRMIPHLWSTGGWEEITITFLDNNKNSNNREDKNALATCTRNHHRHVGWG